MKLFVILSLLWGSLSTTPYSFKEGTPRTEIMNCCPEYHFMFYKKVEQKPFDGMSFGMIGYWENNKGCVLHFVNDTLTYKVEFSSLTGYKKYISNPKESKNIIINQKNLR